MTLLTAATAAFERAPLPDAASRLAIAALVARTGARLRAAPGITESDFVARMAAFPIAADAAIANRQHYELPPEFFTRMLGPQRKYSCCYYETESATLAQAEEAALASTAAHAGLVDGQRILELGCGWGSLSLWMARRFPASRITAVSNSAPQKAAIEARAQADGVSNLAVITADMNDFTTGEVFDRVVSIEMFEHMTNWHALLRRVAGWLAPDGKLFLHVFTHRDVPYLFDAADRADWIAQHFFTSGIMPSETLITQFGDLFTVEESWRWPGTHYARTARDWLGRYDSARPEIDHVLQQVYGAQASLWRRRWRLFLLATEGLFGHAGGSVWGVNHYLLSPRR